LRNKWVKRSKKRVSAAGRERKQYYSADGGLEQVNQPGQREQQKKGGEVYENVGWGIPVSMSEGAGKKREREGEHWSKRNS